MNSAGRQRLTIEMLKIGLTGGIATGKSYVLLRFRERGIPCIDADQLAHGVMSAGTEAARAIAERFGDAILAPDGSVDRARLAPIVFGEPSARRDLEAIVHPAVYRAIAAAVRAFERLGDAPMVVVDVPLLFETGHEGDFDRIIVTACLPHLQIARLMERGLTDEEARQRLAAQMPTPEKVARADYVIRTDGTFEQTDQQVDHVIRELTR